MGRVISYYKPPVTEYLSEHINSCLNLLEKLESSRIGRVGLSLDRNFVDEVRLSVVFHDFGKALYQSKISPRKSSVSFAGHEIFSTYFLFKFRKLIIKGADFNESIRLKPALFAVAFHHHPMDIGRRLERVQQIKLNTSSLEDLQAELSFLRDDALSKEERDLLDSVVSELKGKIENGSIRIDDVKRIFREEICKGFYEKYTSGKEEDVILKKLSYITLVSLVSVDYISASERSGEGTKFGDVIDEFYKLYLDI